MKHERELLEDPHLPTVVSEVGISPVTSLLQRNDRDTVRFVRLSTRTQNQTKRKHHLIINRVGATIMSVCESSIPTAAVVFIEVRRALNVSTSSA
jgi:hypothetical protein